MGLDTFPAELLEGVLLFLDEQTLLLGQRVSRQLSHCIRNSLAIQQALFYQPAQADPSGGLLIPRQNPLLAAKFPHWFPTDDLNSCRRFFGAGDIREFLDCSKAYLRPNASWRCMLVQQPPAISVAWVDRETSIYHVRLRSWNFLFKACSGLRMNTLYDMVVQ